MKIISIYSYLGSLLKPASRYSQFWRSIIEPFQRIQNQNPFLIHSQGFKPLKTIKRPFLMEVSW
jgi:hypothetical protein